MPQQGTDRATNNPPDYAPSYDSNRPPHGPDRTAQSSPGNTTDSSTAPSKRRMGQRSGATIHYCPFDNTTDHIPHIGQGLGNSRSSSSGGSCG
ncbi:hypothetical protein [Leptolyngbya sp. KIOST-1]|uniref:hypothetical protein n=1 Tax=Leptolyngbya sp. KIOST-1 TaxID=1229172 RepID=UPI00055A714E|nr:hypothetical protein [Leptolyngbya sp. KIOST-1]